VTVVPRNVQGVKSQASTSLLLYPSFNAPAASRVSSSVRDNASNLALLGRSSIPLTIHAIIALRLVQVVPGPHPSALLAPTTNSRPRAHAFRAVLPTPSAPPVPASPVTPTVPRALAGPSINAPAVHPIDQSSQTDVASPRAPRVNISTRRLLHVKPAIPAVQVAQAPGQVPASLVGVRTRC